MIYPGCQRLFIFVRQRASRTRVVMILSLDKRPQLLSGAESAGKNIFSVLTKKKKTLSTDWSSTSHVHRRRTPAFWLFCFFQVFFFAYSCSSNTTVKVRGKTVTHDLDLHFFHGSSSHVNQFCWANTRTEEKVKISTREKTLLGNFMITKSHEY